MHALGRAAVALLLLVAGCSPFKSGRDRYFDGLRVLRYDPGAANEDFAEAEADLLQALQESRLRPEECVTAVSIRARCLIELDRHAEVPALVKPAPEGYQSSRIYEGDLAGLALIKAGSLDPERAYAELLMAEKKAHTLKARLHLAWEQVHLLERMGTDKARSEAVKICAQHAGKLDFDALKKRLE